MLSHGTIEASTRGAMDFYDHGIGYFVFRHPCASWILVTQVHIHKQSDGSDSFPPLTMTRRLPLQRGISRLYKHEISVSGPKTFACVSTLCRSQTLICLEIRLSVLTLSPFVRSTRTTCEGCSSAAVSFDDLTAPRPPQQPLSGQGIEGSMSFPHEKLH